MELDDKMWCALAERLQEMHQKNRPQLNGWGVGSWKDTTPFDFDYDAFENGVYESGWALNIDLHDAMNEYWREVAENISKVERFANWVVRDWGQIRGNSPETILEYCRKSAQPWSLDGANGVSSFSKILSAKDRHKFYILDTRVAASLNALQLEFFDGNRIYFSVTGGRNVVIANFNKRYDKGKFKVLGYDISKNDIYSKYNDAVRVMARHLGRQGIEIEMMLFDNAEIIASSLDRIDATFQENIKFLQRKRHELLRETEARLRAQGLI